MQRVRLIVQHLRWSRPLENRLLSLQRSGLALDWRVTRSAQETIEATHTAIHEGIDTLMAGGGDGMVRLIASAMLDMQPPPDKIPSLSILPLGTANDFANACGLSSEAWVQALHSPWYVSPYEVDVWQLQSEAPHSFVNMCTGGTVATIPRDTSMPLKRLLGRHAYALVAAFRMPQLQKMQLRLSSPEADWEGTAYGFMLGNCRTAGGGLELCPEARIDDGLLDVVLVTRLPQIHEVPRLLSRLLKEGVRALPEFVTHFQVSQLQMELQRTAPLEVDGDALTPLKHFQVHRHPQGIRMHVLKYHGEYIK